MSSCDPLQAIRDQRARDLARLLEQVPGPDPEITRLRNERARDLARLVELASWRDGPRP